jgi:RND family efflux transporter MFP subunit
MSYSNIRHASVFVLGTFLLLAGCHKPPEPSAAAKLPMAPIRAKTIDTRKYQEKDEVAGTVRSKTRAVIEAKISGRIEKMLVVAGQEVATGELLAELDAKEIKARYDQAVTVRDQALLESKRYAALIKEKAVTQQEYESVESRYRVAESQASEAGTMLGYTKVTAPFAGVITRKLGDVGDLASPGRPLLEIEDPRALRLEADVPEGLLDRIQIGDKLLVNVASVTNLSEGVVSEIAPVADPNSRTFPVKLDLAPLPGLRAGQFGRVAIPVGTSESLFVPSSAVVMRGQLDLVFVVQTNKAVLRIVKTGKRSNNEVEVLSGLEAGETLTVEGAASLVNGQPVEVKP